MEDITITRSARRRTISIEIKPDASVSVAAPYFYPARTIQKFLEDHRQWIESKRTEILLRNNSLRKNDNEVWYLGKKYPIILRANKNNIVEFDNAFYITSTNPRSRVTYLTSWYKQQARKIIQARLAAYAKRANLNFNSISITEAETRWGSCSDDRNLHFNWRLIMAPIEVVDYVIAHELAHLVEMNHTSDFWETVRKIYPLYRQYRTWLRRNGHTLRI